MDIITATQQRRSTRLRVQIPLTISSMDRRHPLSAECLALVVSAQGCGVQASQELPVETPVLLGPLARGESAAGKVASCQPIGTDGRKFLIGISLYNHGNIWGIPDPPEDWNCLSDSAINSHGEQSAAGVKSSKDNWPYNLVSAGEGHANKR
jgi:hypothetical protein